ncbi:cytochrome P450 [Streptomyces sp. NPDC053542]|uniref:cytochrome P450 n=1 Tax=Streptomyces sp. NPDC053542 TaxID=3365710 RepID=UPI0037CFF361
MIVDTRNIPRAPGRVPLIGHALSLARRPLDFLQSLPKTGPLVRVDLGTMPVYIPTDADLIREVLVTHASKFVKGRLYTRVEPLVGKGLATSSGPVHRRNRRLMQPMFHKERIAGYAAVMSERAQDLVDSWEPGQQLALEQVMGEYTIRTLAEVMFSADLGQPAVESVRRNLPVILKYMLLRAAFPTFLDGLPIPANRKFDAAARDMRAVIDQVVADTRRSEEGRRDDLVALLLDARDADTDEALTDEEVRDELVTILFAGTETTASTLGWFFHEVGRHPEVEKQLLAEIDEVVGAGPVTMEHVPRLGTVKRVLDEIIRLYGVTMLMRRTTEPVELAHTRPDGERVTYRIPADTEVAFSLYAVHRHPELYKNPDDFDPDRWLRDDIPRKSFFPFGAGNRMCIGDAFSWTEATIAIATILQRYTLAPVPGHTPRKATSAMVHPDHVPMTVVPRAG